MYNLRYHIASLVAIFLALSIGLLLGSAITERGVVSDESAALIAQLQKRFDEITVANEELRLGVERDSGFASDVLPMAVSGVLDGQDIVILKQGGRVDGIDAVVSTLRAAGGLPAMVTYDAQAFTLEESPAGLDEYFAGNGITLAAESTQRQRQVASALVAEWREGSSRELTGLLVSAEALEVSSLAGTATIDALVIMEPSGVAVDTFSLECARLMSAAGGSVVAAEAAPSEGGAALSAADAGLSAVDHVTTPQGRFTLVWLLAGETTGYYGSGPGATAYYPDLTVEEAAR